MSTVRLVPRGPFDLAVSASFLCGFTPARGNACATPGAPVVLGFLREPDHRPTVVQVSQDADGVVLRTPSGDAGALVDQVARILSLDHDATPLAAIARRDRVVAKLLRAKPGFRPVAFPSAYEAALWGVLAQRTPMAVASALRRKLGEATASAVTGFGETFFPAPPPKKMLAVRSFPGIGEEKLARLHGIARAALDGKLDTARLRRLPEEEALAELERLRGVGAWTSRHVLYRGCGVADALAYVEPRVLRAVGDAYGLGRTATVAEVARLSEPWRPLRMWVSILLVWELSRTPRWNFEAPRASKGNALPRREGSPARSDRGARQEPLFD